MSAAPETPNPGSDAAIDLGCTCAVLDNAHGRGYMGREGQFVITEGCPLHGFDPADDAYRSWELAIKAAREKRIRSGEYEPLEGREHEARWSREGGRELHEYETVKQQ